MLGNKSKITFSRIAKNPSLFFALFLFQPLLSTVVKADSILLYPKAAQFASADVSVPTRRPNTGQSTQGQPSLQRENSPSGWNDLRVALRAGQDFVWDRGDSYNALGADVSFVRRNVGTRLVRIETGATSSFLSRSGGDYGGYNFHGTLFPAIEVGAFVIGPRGLLGGSKSSPGNELSVDAGGEGRMGVELGNFSMFASAGRTVELTRVGIDLGASF